VFLRLLLLASAMSCVSATAVGADWPMYRGDAARTAHSQESLVLPLSSLWTHADRHAPQPAWPNSRRMQFDWAMQPVVSGKRVVVGSSVDGAVSALDADSGQIVWRFYTEGPIRFAPALWRDRAFVASDDGHLYALRLSNGQLLWKLRGGPGNEAVLGNERMISKWPMRGGPVVVDDVVYCAAGIWPSDGIYLYALDAETGQVRWRNADSGAIYMPQPHGGANAKSGVSAQGYLVAAGQRLFVPTGRAVPASFHRLTGQLEYFHLQKYGHNGASLAMVIDNVLLNGGVGFDVRGGQRLSPIGDGPLAATSEGVIRASQTQLTHYRWQEESKADRKGNMTTARTLKAQWGAEIPFPATSLMTTKQRIVFGGRDKIAIFDPDKQEVVWQAPVEGTVYGLAVAEGRLLVTTDQAVVHCFGAVPEEARGAVTASSPDLAKQHAGRSDELAQLAEQIVRRTQVTRGYCLDIGCGDGSLARELAHRTELHVIAVDPDLQNVRTARKRLSDDGLLGARVTVLCRELTDTKLPSYFADLIVSQRSTTGELTEAVGAEASRLQHPHGGILCWSRQGELSISERGALPGSGDWTHQYADPSNTVNSGDQLVKGRLSVLWFRDINFAVPSRHGRAPAPLLSEGRLFHEGMDGIVAVSAYNGRELWRYDIPDVLAAYDGDELMGVAGTGSNFCVGGDSLFVRDGSRCLRLDVTAGTLIGEFQTPPETDKPNDKVRPPWGYIAWDDGILLGSAANPEHVVTYRYVDRGGDMTRQLTESTHLFAIDTVSGERLWTYEAKHSIRHNAIAVVDGKVLLIDRPLALFDREKRPATKQHPTGTLVALNIHSGKLIWQNDEDIYGTMLAGSAEHRVLLMSYQPTRFRLDSEIGGRMTGFALDSGKRLWDNQARYDSRPTLNDRTIYVQGGAWDLVTGHEVPFEFDRSYGCGILAGSQNMLLFRSATLGYYDLSGSQTTIDYGGIRPGCWINALPAGGLVLMPDATAGCECSYLNKAWIALEPR
jgi:outer membrane protein assembly factor BamB